jgi:hypothetical protein
VADARGPEPPDGPPEFGDDPEHAGDDWSSVVFDDHFVRAASIHEPTAAERQLAAAPTTPPPPADFGEDPYVLHEPRTERGSGVSDDVWGDDFGGPARASWWRQSVAWVLAVLMGVGVVAMAVTAVAPGRSGQNPPVPQPTVGTPASETHTGRPGSVDNTLPAAPALMLCPAPPDSDC